MDSKLLIVNCLISQGWAEKEFWLLGSRIETASPKNVCSRSGKIGQSSHPCTWGHRPSQRKQEMIFYCPQNLLTIFVLKDHRRAFVCLFVCLGFLEVLALFHHRDILASAF